MYILNCSVVRDILNAKYMPSLSVLFSATSADNERGQAPIRAAAGCFFLSPHTFRENENLISKLLETAYINS